MGRGKKKVGPPTFYYQAEGDITAEIGPRQRIHPRNARKVGSTIHRYSW